MQKFGVIAAIFILIVGLGVGVFLVERPQFFEPQAEVAEVAVIADEDEPFSVQEVTEATVWVYTGAIRLPNQRTEVEIKTLEDHLDENGNYTVTFSFAKGPKHNTTEEIQLLIAVERDMCPEGGNGQTREQSIRYTIPSSWAWDGYCFVTWMDDQYALIRLNTDNDYHQELTIVTTQVNNLACGSFQTDIWVLSLNNSEIFSMENSLGSHWVNNNCPLKRLPSYELGYEGKVYPDACMINAWGNLRTGKDLSSCITPIPTPTGCPLPEQIEEVEVVCPTF